MFVLVSYDAKTSDPDGAKETVDQEGPLANNSYNLAKK